jgi:hypothetical protein
MAARHPPGGSDLHDPLLSPGIVSPVAIVTTTTLVHVQHDPAVSDEEEEEEKAEGRHAALTPLPLSPATALLAAETDAFVLYRRRWWVLFLFCLLGLSVAAPACCAPRNPNRQSARALS